MLRIDKALHEQLFIGSRALASLPKQWEGIAM